MATLAGHKLYAGVRQSNISNPDDVFVIAVKACVNAGAVGFKQMCVLGAPWWTWMPNAGAWWMPATAVTACPPKTSMVARYAQYELGQEALNPYASMQLDATAPANNITLVSILKACGSVGAVLEGERLHAYILDRGLRLWEAPWWTCMRNAV